MEKRAVEVVLSLLPDELGARVTPDGIELTGLAGAPRLVPVPAGEGFPADVRHALGLGRHPAETHVVVARRLSPGARQLLEKLGENWADQEGRARIIIPGALYIRQDRRQPARSQSTAFRWSESAGALAEHLIVRVMRQSPPNNPPNADVWSMELPRTTELASAVGLSPAQVSKVLQQFDDQRWTKKAGPERGTGAMRNLRDPSGLLSAWAGWYRLQPQRTITAHATWRDPAMFWRERIKPMMLANSYALTGWLALDQLAPFTTAVPTISCYVDAAAFDHGLGHVMASAELRPSDEPGARITFIRAEIARIEPAEANAPDRCVNEIRLYGDLLRAGLRGDDAAEHLREVRLGF